MPFCLIEQVIGRSISDREGDLIQTFASWLTTEGMTAGGIGPHEKNRLWDRHIADSAAFSTFWPNPPQACHDLGSGAGLPGIMLAILWLDTEIHLIDRSGRRTRLMRRATRILGLDNVSIHEQDLFDLSGGQEAIVMRATLPPRQAMALCGSILAPGGRAVLGLSRSQLPGDARDLQEGADEGLTTTVETVKVLDPPAWMLIMSKS